MAGEAAIRQGDVQGKADQCYTDSQAGGTVEGERDGWRVRGRVEGEREGGG